MRRERTDIRTLPHRYLVNVGHKIWFFLAWFCPPFHFFPHLYALEMGRKAERKCRPNHQRGMQNGSSIGVCTRCIHIFARLETDLHAQSVLVRQSFLHRSSVRSLLRVRCWLGWRIEFRSMTSETDFFPLLHCGPQTSIWRKKERKKERKPVLSASHVTSDSLK